MSKRSSISVHASSGKMKKSRVDPRVPIYDEKTGERVNGVRKTRTGERYECKIYHPITFKDIWVGTFDTVQEASEAYQAKKKQLLESNRGGVICGEFDSKSRVFDEKTGKRIAGVWRTRTGDRYDTKIHDPITRKDIWIGTFDTIQQASEAYNAKKREFDQVSVQGGRRRGRKMDNTAPVASERIPKKHVTKILDPSTRKYGCIGTLDMYQKGFEAYQANKKELQTAMMRRVGEIQEPMEEEALESSSKAFQLPLTMAPDKSSKELVSRMVYNFEDLQKKSVRVTSDECKGSGALGFPIPTEGGGESFMPFGDNHGFLSGVFSKVDDFLSLRLRTGNT